jgi:hypothetical protein
VQTALARSWPRWERIKRRDDPVVYVHRIMVNTWWPGSSYVTWVGIDGFYAKPSDTFSTLFGPTIAQVRSLTAQPILLAETAVARNASQYANIINLFNGISQYGMLGLVWFDNGNWRIQDRKSAERAFQVGVSGLRLGQP